MTDIMYFLEFFYMSTPLPYSAPSVWLAEGQSSQRDMLLALQQMKANPSLALNVIASHRHERPEILQCADRVYQEPYAPGTDWDTQQQQRVDFVLSHASEQGVKVLLTGQNSRYYEARRPEFEAAGIRLLTGAMDTDTLKMLNNKAEFMAYCQAHDIPVAQGWRFDNLAELEALLNKHHHLPLCVKPIQGIFAQGFWRLDTGVDVAWDSFSHLYETDEKTIHIDEFLHAYANSQWVSQRPIPMLLMPYLPGQEYSVDVVCERGEVLAAVTRYKVGRVQHVGFDDAVMDLVTKVVATVNADGIISVQTKADEVGNHQVLEINSRPSGGIGYTDHAFIDKQALNLTQLAFAYWAGLIEKPNLAQVRESITPCAVRSLMTSVRIS